MKVFEQASDLIGNTPLVRLNGYQKEKKLDAELFAKLEYFNPAGSVKDRVALYMLLDAQEKGLLKRDSVIIEPTSGNTGIGLAAVAAEKGIRTIIVMPDTMSIERRNILKAYGAELVLTDGKLGMKGAIAKANELAEEIPHSFIPGQFTNDANPLAHYKTTGPEIWKDTDGDVDILVAGVGTGGTLSGAGRYLKEEPDRISCRESEPDLCRGHWILIFMMKSFRLPHSRLMMRPVFSQEKMRFWQEFHRVQRSMQQRFWQSVRKTEESGL